MYGLGERCCEPRVPPAEKADWPRAIVTQALPVLRAGGDTEEDVADFLTSHRQDLPLIFIQNIQDTLFQEKNLGDGSAVLN